MTHKAAADFLRLLFYAEPAIWPGFAGFYLLGVEVGTQRK